MKKWFTLIVMTAVFFLASCQTDSENEMRIVSLIPSNTEIIAELGLLEDTVMVTTNDDYPKEVKSDKFKKIDPFNLEIEKVIAEKPTHIVSHESNNGLLKEDLEKIKEATGAEVLVVEDAATVEDVFRDIRDVGIFLSREKEAGELLEKLNQDFEEVKRKAEGLDKIKTLAFISPPPEIYTVGENTFISNVFSHVNLVNIFGDLKDYPVVTNEEIIKRNPQMSVNLTGLDAESFEEIIREVPGFKSIDINKRENQCTPDVDLISRPGPRIIEGMDALIECSNN